MTTVFLLEVPARVTGSPTTQTLRVATEPGYNHPTAPGYYAPHLIQPGLIKRHIVASGRILGESQVSFGANIIQNIEGDYDEYFDYGYGDEATLLIGDHEDDYSNFVTVQTAKLEQPEGNDREMVFRWRGRDAELDVVAQPATYAGTNLESPSGEIEGTPSDIKGQPKIRLFGKAENIPADPVDTSDNIFALNHDDSGNSAAVGSVDAVRVNGSAWSPGSPVTDHANLAALQAASPAQGIYHTALALGLVKLGGTIGSGTVTIDATERSTASENRVASLVNRILQDAGVASGDIVSADVTQLESDAPYPSGAMVRGGSYRELIDAIRVGAAAWVAPNRLGKYNMQQIKAPTGSAAATFRRFEYPNTAGASDFAIQQLERLVPTDEGRGVPVWQVTVNYLKFWQVQEGALAGGLSEADKAKYSREFRSVTAEDATIKNQFPLAGSITLNTVLTDESNASSLASHILTLLGSKRDLFRLVARYDVPLASAVDLGDVVEVYHPRFGLTGGKKFNVHGIQYDARKFEIELELWG